MKGGRGHAADQRPRESRDVAGLGGRDQPVADQEQTDEEDASEQESGEDTAVPVEVHLFQERTEAGVAVNGRIRLGDRRIVVHRQ